MIDKQEILSTFTYEQAKQILESNGWQTLWADNYWVRTAWIDQGLNADRMGMNTKDALERCLNELEYKREYEEFAKSHPEWKRPLPST